jgi:hypothetical protein
MNIRKIIREELDDWEWAKEFGPFHGVEFRVKGSLLYNNDVYPYTIEDLGEDEITVRWGNERMGIESTEYSRSQVEHFLTSGSWEIIGSPLNESESEWDWEWIKESRPSLEEFLYDKGIRRGEEFLIRFEPHLNINDDINHIGNLIEDCKNLGMGKGAINILSAIKISNYDFMEGMGIGEKYITYLANGVDDLHPVHFDRAYRDELDSGMPVIDGREYLGI